MKFGAFCGAGEKQGSGGNTVSLACGGQVEDTNEAVGINIIIYFTSILMFLLP